MAMVMGDLVLAEDEVSPVMQALQEGLGQGGVSRDGAARQIAYPGDRRGGLLSLPRQSPTSR